MRKSLQTFVVLTLLASLVVLTSPASSVSALDSLAVPTFTVTRGTNPFLAKLNFTPDVRARYQVRVYFKNGSYSTAYKVSDDYTPGTDATNIANPPADASCSNSIGLAGFVPQDNASGFRTSYCSAIATNRTPVKFSLIVINRETSEVLPESAKSSPVGFLQGGRIVAEATSRTDNQTGIKVVTGILTGATKNILTFRRSDNYANIYLTSSPIPFNSGTEGFNISLPGGYRYKIGSTITGGVSGGVTWFDSDSEEIFDGVYASRKPGAVTNIVAVPNVDGGIDVSWTAPSAGPSPTSYSIFVTTNLYELLNVMNYVVSAPATSVTIPGLRSVSQSLVPFDYGTQYYVAIKPEIASPDTTSGPFFSMRPVVPQLPPGSPVASYSVGDSRISATWAEPSFTGGVAPKAYELQASANGTTWTSARFAGTATSGSIGGLTNGVAYSIRLRAFNDAGPSSWDTTSTATPIGVPTAVTEAISAITSTSARIAMSVNAQGDDVSVSLQYRRGLGSGVEVDVPLGSTSSTTFSDGATVTGLTPGRFYQVRAVATAASSNITYYGQWRSFTTTPNAASNIVVTAASTSVSVAWDTPDVSPAVLRYTVWAELNGTQVGVGCTNLTRSSNRGSCVISGLSSGVIYNIRTSVTPVGADFGNATSVLSSDTVTTKRPQSILDKSNLLPKLYQSIADQRLSTFFPTDSGLTISASSSTTSVCLIGSGPTLSIRASGTCTLTLSQSGNSIFAAAESKTVSLVVAAQQTISIGFNSLTSPKVGAAPVDISSYASASSGLTVSFATTTPSVCTVDGVNVSPLTAGECEIVGNQVGNDSYMPAPQNSASFMVVKGDQAALSITSVGGSFNQAVSLQTSGGTGVGVVTYSLNSTGNTSNCVITSLGVKAQQPGDCIVKATKATDANYSQVSSQYKTLVFTKADQAITFVTIPDTLEGTVLNATVSSTSGLSVSLQSLTTGVCTVTGTSVSLDHAGTCRIKASQTGSTNFNAASDVTMVFESNSKAIPQIGNLLYDRTRNYYIGDTIDFTVAASVNGQQSEVPGTFTWSVDTPGVLQFDPQVPGRATVVSRSGAGGMVQVIYKFTPDTASSVLYNPAVGVAALQVQLTSQPLTLAAQTVPYDEPAQMNVSGILGTGQVTYGLSPLDASFQNTSARNSKCTVTGPVVTRSEPGTCVVRALIASDTRYLAADAIQEFVFAKKKQTLSIQNTALLEQANYADRSTTYDLTTMAVSSEGLTVGISTTSSACSISAGVLTVVSAGQCVVKLSQAGTSTIEEVVEYLFTFNIGKAPQSSLALSSTSATFAVPLSLSASGGTGNGAVSYSVSDGAATGCRIANGALLSDTAGSCLVEVAKGEDVNYSALTSGPEIVVVEKSGHTMSFSLSSLPTVRVGDTPFSIASYAQLSSGEPATFVSGSPSVCTVNGAFVTPISNGQCIIDAQYPESTNYVAVSAITRYFTVQAASSPTTTQPTQSSATQISVSAPVNVSLARATSKALTASWSEPLSGKSTITTYVATLMPGGKRCSVSTTSCTFTGLDATLSYSVSVVAVSATMTSESASSGAVVPNIQMKVNGKTNLKTMITTTSQGTKSWSVSGGCKISRQMFIASSKASTCTLALKTAKYKTTPAATKRASVAITK